VLAILIALSVLPAQQGGPYVAIYTLPLLIRLARRSRVPSLCIGGYAATYALLMFLGLAHHNDTGLLWVLFVIYPYWPIVTALTGSVLLARLAAVPDQLPAFPASDLPPDPTIA
jgi:hypothetical protein